MTTSLTRRRFVGLSLSAAMTAPFVARGGDSLEAVFEIGLVADAQYADIEPTGTRYYRRSIARLTEAVSHFNGRDLAFCIHLGDLIDQEWQSFDEILEPLAASRHAWHHLLGNHDFHVLDELKPRVPGRLGMERRYYAFDHGGLRFVVLDTNDVSTFAHREGTPERAAAAEELKRLEAANIRQGKVWNGGLGRAQLEWFERRCREVRARPVIVFAHQPVAPENEHNVWNSAEVLALLDRNANVVAWFNGHNHQGNYAERNGTHFVTLRGMVETSDTTAFATVRIEPGRIVLTGHGREPSRELKLRRE